MRILVVAGIHGDELNGVEAAHRLKDEFDVVEIANPLAFKLKSRTYKGEDMNRCFPGRKDGSQVERLAYRLFKKIKDYSGVADLHCGSTGRRILPQVRVRVKEERLLSFCSRTGLPVVFEKEIKGSLQVEALKIGIPVATIEAGEGGRIEEESVSTLIKAVRALAHGGKSTEFYSRVRVLSPASGEVEILVKLGEKVEKGEPVAVVNGIEVESPATGVVLDLKTSGVSKKGECIVGVGVNEPRRVL